GRRLVGDGRRVEVRPRVLPHELQKAQEVVGRVEIDELGHPLGMGRRNLRQLLTGQGMADEVDLREAQRVEHLEDVGSEAGRIVAGGWLTRGTEAAARDSPDMEITRQLGRKVVVDVGGGAQSSKEYHRR